MRTLPMMRENFDEDKYYTLLRILFGKDGKEGSGTIGSAIEWKMIILSIKDNYYSCV
jgi:hypothetical protein